MSMNTSNTGVKIKIRNKKFTTFGVGRNAYKKVVSQNDRNYGEPHDRSTPGPGEYSHKNNYEMGTPKHVQPDASKSP